MTLNLQTTKPIKAVKAQQSLAPNIQYAQSTCTNRWLEKGFQISGVLLPVKL